MKARRPRLASLTSPVAACCLLLWSITAPADPEAAKPPAAEAADAPASTKRTPPAPAAPPPAMVVELPNFTPGLWEYRRTVVMRNSPKPQVSTIRKCADPAAEIRDKMAELKKKNCQFTPLRRNKERYLSSWICPTPAGPMKFRDVLIANDTTSYQDASESRSAQGVTQQKIEATRLGECPGLGVGAPLPRTPKRAPPAQQPKPATG